MGAEWKITPADVQTVMVDAGKNVEEIGKDFSNEDLAPVAKAVTMPDGAGNGSRTNGVTGSVMDALNRLFSSEKQNMDTIKNTAGAGILGVVNATVAYQTAQQSMADDTNRYSRAAEMQAHMFTAAQNGDLSWYETNGYLKPSQMTGGKG